MAFSPFRGLLLLFALKPIIDASWNYSLGGINLLVVVGVAVVVVVVGAAVVVVVVVDVDEPPRSYETLRIGLSVGSAWSLEYIYLAETLVGAAKRNP